MARPLRFLSAGALLAIGLLLGSACQVALRADGEDARCEPEGIVCGAGSTCQGGFCRPCNPQPEECNGKDDNCDGQIDEGFDQDGDGFKTCGEAGQIDCNDDPTRGGKDVYPGHAEICNGYDDNCNGVTDEEPNDCDALGEECWSSKGKCTVKGDCRLHGCTTGGCNPDTGKCTDPDCRISGKCGTGEMCDPTKGICVKVTDFGEPCDAQAVCKAGSSCIDLSEIGLTARSAQICTKACCDSSGCPDGFVCRAGSTGGASMCVKASDVGATIGVQAAATKCTEGGACRSGICSSGYCQDGCCSTPACGDGGTCSFKSDNKFGCRNPVGTKNYGESCSGDSSCTTGFCWTDFFGGTCSKHCCSSEDCDNNWKCTAFTQGGMIFNACSPMSFSETQGSKRAGEACGADSECRSAHCVDSICSDNCCRDTDCAGGTICRPTKLSGGAIANRCQKPGS